MENTHISDKKKEHYEMFELILPDLLLEMKMRTCSELP